MWSRKRDDSVTRRSRRFISGAKSTNGGKAGPRQEGKTKGKMDLSMKGAHSEYSSAEMRETYSLDEKSRF